MLTHVADIRRLSHDELARRRPAELRGVVTFSVGGGDFVIDDGEGIFARWLSPKPAADWGVKLGDVVELKGTARGGMFAPIVEIASVKVVGRSELPSARAVPVTEIFTGEHDAQRVEVRGVIQWVHTNSAGEQQVDLVADEHLLAARFFSKAPLDRARLIDAEVRVAGVATQDLNTRREAIGAAIRMGSLEELVIMSPAPEAPWESPLVEFSQIAAFRAEGLPRHRIRVRGGVSLVVPGQWFYIQDGLRGLHVQSFQTDALAPGDEVEVLGFVKRGERFAELGNAIFRKVGGGTTLAAREVDLGEIFSANIGTRDTRGNDFDGRLVAIRGVLQSVERTVTDGARLYVLTGGQSIAATVEAGREAEALRRLLPGSEVRVVGVCVLEFDTPPGRAVAWEKPTRFHLLLRSGEDVRVLSVPSWWSPKRLAIALLGMVLTLGLVLAWVLALRRQVRRQLDIIGDKHRVEAVDAERNRMARDLHDSLEQHLAGVALHLDGAARNIQQDDSPAAEAITLARQMLRHTRTEARRSVWDLRSEVLEREGLAAALLALAKNSEVPFGQMKVEVEITGQPSPLPQGADFHLLRIAQEALANVLKHARATRVLIRLEYQPQAVTLSVQDDGQGFDPAASPGMRGAHFGIQGMRERAIRSGAELTIAAAPGNGCCITVILPCASQSRLKSTASD